MGSLRMWDFHGKANGLVPLHHYCLQQHPGSDALWDAGSCGCPSLGAADTPKGGLGGGTLEAPPVLAADRLDTRNGGVGKPPTGKG